MAQFWLSVEIKHSIAKWKIASWSWYFSGERSFDMPIPGSTEYSPREGSAPPCKACSAFKTWAKVSPGKDSNSEQDKPQAPMIKPKVQCPLDKDSLGRYTWGFLHTMAAYYPDNPTQSQMRDMTTFFTIFGRFYPCETCAEHFRNHGIVSFLNAVGSVDVGPALADEPPHHVANRKLMNTIKWLEKSPPVVASQQSLSEWLCWIHNQVNRRIGKPQFDCRMLDQRWREGWADGSCD